MESTRIITDYVPLKPMESENDANRSSISPVYSLTSASPLADDVDIPMVSNKSNSSLFPTFDLLIRYLPTYYTKHRHKCINALCISICLLSILSMPIYQIYRWIELSEGDVLDQSRAQLMEQTFVFIVYFFPFCSAIARLWFFTKHCTLEL